MITRRSVVASTAALIPFLLLAADALLHPTRLTTPAKPAGSNKPGAAPVPQCSTLPQQYFCFRRTSKYRGDISSRCSSSSSSSSTSPRSRSSRLEDALSYTTRMSLAAEGLDVWVVSDDGRTTTTYSGSSGGGGGGAKLLSIQASYVEPGTGTRRTWTASRSEKDFFALGVTLMGKLAGSAADAKVPGPPPEGSSPVVFEVYLRRLIDVPVVTSLPALYEFLDAPPDLVQEPVLFGEVVDDDFGGGRAKRYRSANPDDPRTASSSSAYGNNVDGNKSGATVAGAVVGGLVAGPVGAAIGAIAARAASGREDGVGNVAKGAGAVADAAMEKAQALEREFELSRKAKTAAGKAKQAVQKVDTDYSVRQRAKEAAKRTVRAAQKTTKDLRVTERATEAAKATEKAARKAAEAARKADKEHRIRERAINAFRRVRSQVKRSVENLEERRKADDNNGGAPKDGL
ncbi:unnamed protein product [Ectocarpus sp. CCAP 1310/34]|nr:unnamed protein product [Ectocarpus sp. CCAP 1310/34]